jgi:hypothetical protein
MNDLSQKIMDQPVPSKPGSQGSIWIGFLIGAVPWLLTCIPQKDYRAVLFLIFACFGLPIVSAIFAIIPKTRQIGLGLLLASGLGWLILGALCSGLFR